MKNVADADDLSPDTRSRILSATAELIRAGGVEAATTRAVAQAAAIQAPTIYRLFGDKQGLLDAVAEAELAAYVAGKAARASSVDPVADLAAAWDDHIAFCLSHPALFAMMSSVGSGAGSAAARAGVDVLRERIRCIARTGLLCVSEEHAVDLVHATGNGIIGVMLAKPERERDGLSAAAFKAVMSAILEQEPEEPEARGLTGMASGLRARLDEVTVLSPGERHLLEELLHRIASS